MPHLAWGASMGSQPQAPASWRWRMRTALRLGTACAVPVLLVLVYWFAVRPGQLRWGATAAELRMTLPEDGIVADPAFDYSKYLKLNE